MKICQPYKVAANYIKDFTDRNLPVNAAFEKRRSKSSCGHQSNWESIKSDIIDHCSVRTNKPFDTSLTMIVPEGKNG